MRSYLKKIFFPVLSTAYNLYSSKERSYSYKKIKINILPGIFHPGLFFSTKILIEYLSKLELNNKTILELGAGAGLISVYCARRDAIVTASDINPTAITNIINNAELNNVKIKAVESDLFDKIESIHYDYIIINPPYFPKTPKSVKEYAWFCGSDFEYFKKLFSQLKNNNSKTNFILMILSEDCDFERVNTIANENDFHLTIVYQKKIFWENNFIYRIE
jgi:release factor glutamine methyltransferase